MPGPSPRSASAERRGFPEKKPGELARLSVSRSATWGFIEVMSKRFFSLMVAVFLMGFAGALGAQTLDCSSAFVQIEADRAHALIYTQKDGELLEALIPRVTETLTIDVNGDEFLVEEADYSHYEGALYQLALTTENNRVRGELKVYVKLKDDTRKLARKLVCRG